MADHTEIIGRDDVNDLEAILVDHQQRRRRDLHAVHADADAIFTWDYERSRPALVKLYEKAKTSQWNANDRPRLVRSRSTRSRSLADEPEPERLRTEMDDLTGTPFETWGDKEWIQFGRRVAELDAVAVHAR